MLAIRRPQQGQPGERVPMWQSAWQSTRQRPIEQARRRWSFRRSFPQVPLRVTGPHYLDGVPDLTSEDGTLRDGVDGCRLTSNP